jgi:hypothetical protein
MFLIGIVFLGLWIAGLATSYTLGGFIHVLLILAIVVAINSMIRGNRTSKLHELRASQSDSGQR